MSDETEKDGAAEGSRHVTGKRKKARKVGRKRTRGKSRKRK